tara:strand:+ start:89 stop:403 length:315 start_codon:yes stop_codon:yes gene_type:complete
MRKGIYAKALADGLGVEGKAQSFYIKYRVQSLVDEQRGKAEQLGIEFTTKAKTKKAKDKQDAKIHTDYEWEYETSWFTKIILYIIAAPIIMPAWFWFSTKFLGL